MSFKTHAHQVLSSIIYNVAQSGKARGYAMTIPYYELAKEVGFGQKFSGVNIKLTITAEVVDDDGEIYEDREPASDN